MGSVEDTFQSQWCFFSQWWVEGGREAAAAIGHKVHQVRMWDPSKVHLVAFEDA